MKEVKMCDEKRQKLRREKRNIAAKYFSKENCMNDVNVTKNAINAL